MFIDDFTQSLLLAAQLPISYLLFGLLFGSFLNVVINRIPEGKSIIYPPSSCPKCGYQIKWHDNIPVLSWLLLRGKCRKCKTSISIQYPIIELFYGILVLCLYQLIGFKLQLLFILPLSFILTAITVIDFKTYSIPLKMQYSLLTIAITAIILNIFDPTVLNLSIFEIVSGALTGYSILWLIQIIGRKIYKQEAMGGGDLWLLAISGLFLGPKGAFFAFMSGSIFAVIAYTIPTIYKMLTKQKEVEILLQNSQKVEELLPIKENLSLELLKMQISIHTKNPFNPAEIEQLFKLCQSSKAILKLEAFFRFIAINHEELANQLLKSVEESQPKPTPNEVEQLLRTDLLGYGNYQDNYQLLHKYTQKNKLVKLTSFIEKELTTKLNEEISPLEDSVKMVNSCKTPQEKLTKLLSFNRTYQYSGYTAEQLVIADLIEKQLLAADNKELTLSTKAELAYVYYTDLFYKNYNIEQDTINSLFTEQPNQSLKATINLYNIALYRLAFYRQKLAFGPYLAMGILTALIYGEKVWQWYISLIMG